MKSVLRFWQSLIHLGLERGDNRAYYKEIVFLNRYIALEFLVIVLYIPLEVLTYGWDMIPSIFGFGVVTLFTYFFTAMQQFNAARIFYLLITNVFVSYLVIQAGGVLDNEFLFLPVSLLGLAIFRHSRLLVYGNFILSTVLFFVSTALAPMVGPLVIISPESQIKIMHSTHFLTFLFTFLILANFRRVAKEFYRTLRLKSKIIENKNEEISQSLAYARKLQSALTPDFDKMDKEVIQAEVFYQPKDIVSGDFPFYFHEEEGVHWIAVGDCTGHGVPGSMVSIVCMNTLNRLLMTKPDLTPAQLLDHTSLQVEGLFNKTDQGSIRDGMDISLARLEIRGDGKIDVQWAGANNPIWIHAPEGIEVVEAKEEGQRMLGEQLTEFRPDHQPVGKYHYKKPFTNHKFTISHLSRLYLFSDGYLDQFGGPQNKKFKRSRFVRLISSLNNISMELVAQRLETQFREWKGDNEQIDDVLVVAIGFTFLPK